MTRGGSYGARNGILTTRSGVYSPSGRLGEVIESFEPGYPVGDGRWKSPTWSGDARHIEDVNSSITRSGDGSLWMEGYYEDWALPDEYETPPRLGRPIRCWFYPLDWRSGSGTGSQYWFTLGDPSEDSRHNRLEFNVIHDGTVRIRYRNGSAHTVTSLDGGDAFLHPGHNAIENVWYALDFYTPGSRAMASTNFAEGETLPPGVWQAALHEDGVDTDPVTFDFEHDAYQDWPGDELKLGVWVGYGDDRVVWDDIQYLAEAPAPTTPDTNIIDDFEEYDSSQDLAVNWTIDGSGSAEITSDAALHTDSTQGVEQHDTSQLRSFPGQGLDAYPEDGVESGLLFSTTSESKQPRVLLAMDEDDWSTEVSTWQIEFHGGLRLTWQPAGGSSEIMDQDLNHEWVDGHVYDLRFLADSTDGVSAWAVDESGTTVSSVSTPETYNVEPEMSIGLRTAGGCQWDYLRQITV